MKNTSILLIISGGIAAYKSLELIRLLRKSGANVRAILTAGGEKFVTPLSVSALCEHPVYNDLWSLKDEAEMGHIRLSREADLILIAPASANMIARMAHGLADDLASTVLLAADKPVIIAPAMNHRMWLHPATQANIATLKSRGVTVIGPDEGDMACGEFGPGRMVEPEAIVEALTLSKKNLSARPDLKGLKALVTAGPTHEPLDPVRFIGNRSSGKQGYAIAESLARAGAEVTLVSGPVALPPPAGIKTIAVQTAAEMLKACESALPADIAVCAAAVSDWRPETVSAQKLKKSGRAPSAVQLTENPDILKTLSGYKNRPCLVVGFAAETEYLEKNARAKLAAKGCDWILANNVSENPFGTDANRVVFLSHTDAEDWGLTSKTAIADKLTAHIAAHFKEGKTKACSPKSLSATKTA